MDDRSWAARAVRGALIAAVLLCAWQAGVSLFQPPRFLFPSPADVAEVFSSQFSYLASNSWITIREIVLGFVAGSAAGAAVALLLSHFRLAERYVMPVVVLTQTLPVFAIAPLLVIWFGFGLGSKVVMASLIIFFPVASAFHDGLRATRSTYLDLSRIWGAGRVKELVLIRLPAALPSLGSGLKIAATVAPIGAVVGEWAGAAGGLGFVMLQANARTQTAVVFAALILLGLFAWLMRLGVVFLVNRIIWWEGRTA